MTPPGEVTEWRVHVGAHKTATSHLQETRVWRQEDHAAEPPRFIRAFVGADLPGVPDRPPPRGTVTPSAEAIAEVEALIRAGARRRDPSGWQARVNAAYAGRPADMGTPFRPLDPEAAARHARAYAEDVAAIHRDRPGCLIEP